MIRLVVFLLCAGLATVVAERQCFFCDQGILESKVCEDTSVATQCFNEIRSFNYSVTFIKRPSFVIDIMGYHYKDNANGRMVVRPLNIWTHGARVTWKTWEDTHFVFLKMSYMVCGLIAV